MGHVSGERRDEHPGTQRTAIVDVCGDIRTDEPPSFGTLLNAGISGSGSGNLPVAGEAKQAAAAAGKVAGFSAAALISLAASIAEILAGWFQAVVTKRACAQLKVGYHIATPGTWQGTRRSWSLGSARQQRRLIYSQRVSDRMTNQAKRAVQRSPEGPHCR